MKMVVTTLLIILLGLAFAYGQIPREMTFQGFLTDDSGLPLSGSYDLTFRICDANAGGNVLWTEDQAGVAVDNGLFSVVLGSITPIDLTFDAPYWLEIQVGDGDPLLPRTQLTSVGYAFKAADADGVQGRGVSPNAPAAGQVLKWDGALWSPANDNAAGVALPFDGVADADGSAFKVKNTGAGAAMEAVAGNSGDVFVGKHNDSTLFVIDANGAVTMTPDTGGTEPILKIENDDSELAMYVEQIGANRGVWIEQKQGGYDGLYVNMPDGGAEGIEVHKAGSASNGHCIEAYMDAGAGSCFRGYQAGNGPALVIEDAFDGGVNRVIDIRRTKDASSNGDIIQLLVGENSPDDFQFLECEWVGDVKLRIQGNGDVLSDGAFTGGGADFAEMVSCSDVYSVEPGDVVVISTRRDRTVEKSTEANSTRVFGVCTDKPGFIGSRRSWNQTDTDDSRTPAMNKQYMKDNFNEVPMAVVGIVECKVSAENGPITPGDLLVTSGTPGHAMKAPADAKQGTILGKAFGSLSSGRGVMEVYVTVH